MNAKIITGAKSCVVAAVAVVSVAAAAQERAGTPPAHRTAETTLAEWLVDKDARLSELVGRRVINAAGTDLGEVEDLLSKAGREQRPIVVLSIGGVLDIGDKWHATSLDQLRISADGERLVLDMTEAELEASPGFDYVAMMGEESHLPGVRGPGTTNSIGHLLGATVVDEKGGSLGEIEDFVVSTGDKGTRAVVDLDDEADPRAGGRRVAIPYDDLSIEVSGEEAGAVPQQARVRADLDGTPVETLPVYDYPDEEPI